MAGRQTTSTQYFTSASDRPFEDKSEIKILEADNFTPVVSSLRRILQTVAQTNEEKFKILEERDKLYKIMKDKDSSLKKGALLATCPDMCPEKERLLRDYQGRGSIFEMTNYSKTSSFNHCLAIKEYARSSADQEEPLPHDLRPINVLMMTMSHLLHNVVDYCELSDDNLEEWYMFLWDRTRALRKELTQQRVCNLDSVTLVEQCARFHIHCAERLIDQDSSIYDDKINTENLTKCLQTLKYMYKDLAREEIECMNEPEFICYSLLLNLNNSSVFTELSDMSSTLMTSEPVKFALDVMTTWETRNYIRFFNLVKKTTYLNCCLLRRYFGEMRLYAIKTMIRSYCTKTYSPQILISRFVEMLNFDGEEECLNFLSYCNFNVVDIDGKTAVNFERIHFQNPNTTIPSGRAFLFIEEKKQRPLSIIMAGGIEPPLLYKDCIRQNSFTPNGELDPELPPQKELIDFFLKGFLLPRAGSDLKNDHNKSANVTVDVFSKAESVDSSEESKLRKIEEATGFSHSPLFSFKKENIQSSVFGAVQTFGKVTENSNAFGNINSITNTAGNVFNISGEDKFSKNIFGNQGSSGLFNFNRNLFGNYNPKTFPAFNVQEKQAGLFINNSGNFLMNLQPKEDEEAKLKEEKELREKLEKEKLERERIEREKEEENRRKKEEEEKLKILMEKKREEENRKRELERRERKRKEEEERREKEELARREKEERNRKEEEARNQRLREANAKHLAELKRQEEIKRRIALEHTRKVENKMKDLKSKMRKWKTKIVFDKWRMKTWTTIEGEKMKEYLKEVKLKYPPVCTEEMLNGNPYGLLIPSVLTLEKFRNWKKEYNRELSKKMLIVNDELPLLKIDSILGRILKERARSLGCKSDPFSWKLVISVPDELESEYSRSIETFVEMHFVEDFQWQFGLQKGPLYCRSGSCGTFRFNVSIRRVRGSKLFEGIEPNPSATTGSNALLFFEDGSESACDRLKAVLKSRRPLPKIPVVIFPLNSDRDQGLTKLLELETSMRSHISKIYVVSGKNDKQNLVAELIKCLRLAVAHSAPPSFLRITKFSKFFSELWLDSIWRRVEIGLSNYKIILHEPKILIEFYNSCLEKLSQIFLDKKTHAEQTVVAPEFSSCDLNVPIKTFAFEEKLKKLLDELKLPHWPAETPKSCHQLNYRIHQYCKKVSNKDKPKTKNLKWHLYRIIRQSLLWKGLDIYCDEDIYKILINFPWILVFQEVSRIVARQVCEKLKDGEDLIVTYDVDKIDKFSFESSFIGKFLKKSKVPSSKKISPGGEDEEKFDDLSPRLEKDSIVYAYTAAIERETNKRKREECHEENLDALFSSPAGKRLTIDEEITEFDVTEIETNFQNLDSQLNEMKKKIAENFETLTNIYKELQ